MAYSPQLIDHYENPRNVGSFNKDDPDVGTGLTGAPACGDVMKLQIKVKDGIIIDARFKTYGCLTSNAPVNTPTRIKKIKGLTLDQALSIQNSNIAEELALPPVKSIALY
jgi:nitrogen fixation NifU-like protein